MRWEACAILLGIALLLSIVQGPGVSGAAATDGLPPGPKPSSAGYIGDPVEESTHDPDSDGLIDTLRLDFPIVLNGSGTWWVRADLFVADAYTTGNFSEVERPAGRYPFNLTFDGWRIRLGHGNGPYRIDLQLVHVDSLETWSRAYQTSPYEWMSFELRIELAGSYADEALDVDEDGLFNYLHLSGLVNVGQPDTYEMTLYLFDASGGRFVASGFNGSRYSVGTTRFHVYVNGDAIRSSGIDGPYYVEVQLAPEPYTLTYITDAFTTATYGASEFYHHPVEFAAPIVDSGIDRDVDGWYDAVRVTVPLNVMIPGGYYLYGQINCREGYVFTSRDAVYPSGFDSVDLDFDGFALRRECLLEGIEGRGYSVELGVQELMSSYQVSAGHTTQAYSYRDFDNPYGHLRSSFSIEPQDSDGDGLFDLLWTNATIDVEAPATFEIFFSLRPSSPYEVLEYRTEVASGPGTLTVPLAYPGWRLRVAGGNGTYQAFVSVRVDEVYIDEGAANGTYTWDQFDPAVELRGAPTFDTLDTDGDDLANQLVVTLPLRVDAIGLYQIVLRAYDDSRPGSMPVSVYRTRLLRQGEVDTALSLSGIELRKFTGNASIQFSLYYETGGGSLVLGWTGVYPIPDPRVFQDVPTSTVVFRAQAAEPLICCVSVSVVNYTNAYVPERLMTDVPVELPELSYIVSVVGSSSAGIGYETLRSLTPPFPSEIVFDLSPIGDLTDSVEVDFTDWSSPSYWANRTWESVRFIRLGADLAVEPDGFVTMEEALTTFSRPGMPPLPRVGLSLDGEPVVGLLFLPIALGVGPVLDPSDVGVGGYWSGSAAPSDGSHRISVNLLRSSNVRSFATITVPENWLVTEATAPPGVLVTGLWTREVRIEFRQPDVGSYLVNLTAEPVPGSISGRVVDEEGTPIPGGNVTLLAGSRETQWATTGADGTFSFDEVVPGEYTVRIRAPGFLEATRPISAAAEEPRDLGTIALVRAPPATGSVVGRVVDRDGDPIRTATVAIRAADVEVAQVTSAADGAFRLTDIAPGTYVLWVNATGFRGTSVDVTVAAGDETNLGDIVLQTTQSLVAQQGLDPLTLTAVGLSMAAAISLGVFGFLRLRKRRC